MQSCLTFLQGCRGERVSGIFKEETLTERSYVDGEASSPVLNSFEIIYEVDLIRGSGGDGI